MRVRRGRRRRRGQEAVAVPLRRRRGQLGPALRHRRHHAGVRPHVYVPVPVQAARRPASQAGAATLHPYALNRCCFCGTVNTTDPRAARGRIEGAAAPARGARSPPRARRHAGPQRARRPPRAALPPPRARPAPRPTPGPEPSSLEEVELCVSRGVVTRTTVGYVRVL